MILFHFRCQLIYSNFLIKITYNYYYCKLYLNTRAGLIFGIIYKQNFNSVRLSKTQNRLVFFETYLNFKIDPTKNLSYIMHFLN